MKTRFARLAWAGLLLCMGQVRADMIYGSFTATVTFSENLVLVQPGDYITGSFTIDTRLLSIHQSANQVNAQTTSDSALVQVVEVYTRTGVLTFSNSFNPGSVILGALYSNGADVFEYHSAGIQVPPNIAPATDLVFANDSVFLSSPNALAQNFNAQAKPCTSGVYCSTGDYFYTDPVGVSLGFDYNLTDLQVQTVITSVSPEPTYRPLWLAAVFVGIAACMRRRTRVRNP